MSSPDPNKPTGSDNQAQASAEAALEKAGKSLRLRRVVNEHGIPTFVFMPRSNSIRMSTGGGGPKPSDVQKRLRRMRERRAELAEEQRARQLIARLRDLSPVPAATRPYDRAGARAERRMLEEAERREADRFKFARERARRRLEEEAQRRQEEEAHRQERRELLRRLHAKKPPNTTDEAWADYQEQLDYASNTSLGGTTYGNDFDDEDMETMVHRANQSYLREVERIDPAFARQVRRSEIGGTLVPPAQGATTQTRRRRPRTARPPTQDEDPDMEMGGAEEFDRAEGVLPRTQAQAALIQRADREVADLTNHMLRERSTEAADGVLSLEEVQEVIEEGARLYNQHTTRLTSTSDNLNNNTEDQNGLIGLNLPLTLDPSGAGYFFDTEKRTTDAPAPPTSQQPAVTLGPQPILAADVKLTALPSGIRLRGSNNRQLKANVIRPTDYWKIPEADHDEESTGELTSTQIKYDRHSDYPRGKSTNYTGARKGDRKAFPEFHSMTAAKERLGLAKLNNKFIDLFSPATVFFRYELQRLMKQYGYKRGMRKDRRPEFDLFVREVAAATRVLPEGIRRVLLQAYEDAQDQVELEEGEANVDRAITQEIWDQDRRFFMHPWESLVAYMADTVLKTEEDARRCMAWRDGTGRQAPPSEDYVLGHTPALRRWYGSASNLLPFPVQEFADEAVPDIDHTTGHPFGALDENNQPFPSSKDKKGKKKGGDEEENE